MRRPKIAGRDGLARRATDLDEFRIRGAHQVQQRIDGDAEWHLVHAWPGAIAGHAHQLRPRGFGGAVDREPGSAMFQDACGTDEGFDVVDGSRLVQIATLGWKGRTVAGGAPFALQRFQQRGFLAANIGAGTELNADVEVKTDAARDRRAQQPGIAPPLQRRLKGGP